MNTKNKKKEKPFKRLVCKGDYPSFPDFYEKNKEIIYKTIIDVFDAFKVKNDKNLLLLVTAKIDGFSWKTEFKFSKNESIILKRDILPHFELNEDYETCERIKILHNELTFNK
jgi:hypothetical protein